MATSELDKKHALDVATRAVLKAGSTLLELHSQPIEVLSAIGHDIKLRADQLAEGAIMAALNAELPLPILTEESGEHGDVNELSRMWIIDPLDATYNYSRSLPLCCSSVALWENGEPVLGAIYNFFTDELFTGVVGGGAWLNGHAIQVSTLTEISKAALATGFPAHRDMSAEALQQFIARAQAFKKVRMIGSAALAAVFVACGRVDVYQESNVFLWDVAAAAAITQAAGGISRIQPGTAAKWSRTVVMAAHPALLDAFSE